MFENEAEENGFGIGCTVNPTKAFQKGATVGYDKANEWHSVYDELPKENKKYWVLTSSGEPKVDDWVSVSWAYSDDIIAWKEIVYPKEIANTNGEKIRIKI